MIKLFFHQNSIPGRDTGTDPVAITTLSALIDVSLLSSPLIMIFHFLI